MFKKKKKITFTYNNTKKFLLINKNIKIKRECCKSSSVHIRFSKSR